MRAQIAAAFLLVFVATTALAAAPSTDAPATATDGKAAHLDALFAELHAAPSVEQGKVVEGQIVDEWLQSGDPEIDLLMRKAMVAMGTGVLNQAFGYLDQVIARDPNYVEGWNKRATVYYMIDAYDKSLADIQKTLQLEPRHFGALAGLGMIMIKLGDKQRALEAFERAYQVDPVINNGKEVIEELKDEISKAL
ncbi:MAG: tetratricopeptide repeat protein [Bauldia sp.]